LNLSGSSSIRDIAQLGRAPALGAGCRRFKSYYPESSFRTCFENLVGQNFFEKLLTKKTL
jgi:hypothetical protein